MASQRPASANQKSKTPEPPPVPVPPAIQSETLSGRLFRRCDWIAAGVAFLIAMAGYVYMMAPNVTLGIPANWSQGRTISACRIRPVTRSGRSSVSFLIT